MENTGKQGGQGKCVCHESMNLGGLYVSELQWVAEGTMCFWLKYGKSGYVARVREGAFLRRWEEISISYYLRLLGKKTATIQQFTFL